MGTLAKIIFILNLLKKVVRYSSIFINIFSTGLIIGIKKLIIERGNTINDIKGTNNKLRNGLNKFILLKLFIRIGILAKKAIILVINNLEK